MASAAAGPTMRDLAVIICRFAGRTTAESLFDTLAGSACAMTDCAHALVLIHESERSTLGTWASAGYSEPGSGSEVAVGDMLIGQAACCPGDDDDRDLSRMRRKGRAAADGAALEDSARMIALPQIPGDMSQISVRLWTTPFRTPSKKSAKVVLAGYRTPTVIYHDLSPAREMELLPIQKSREAMTNRPTCGDVSTVKVAVLLRPGSR